MFKTPFLRFILIILLLNIVLYNGIIFGGYALYFRDIYSNYYPILEFISDSLQQGDIPFWNPFLYLGTPQLAGLEPPLFYPLTWLFFLGMPFRLALTLNLILHHLLAATGIYLFGQELKWNQWTRIFAACFYSFSGVMISMNNMHPLQNSAAWIPLVWWATHKLFMQPAKRSILILAGCYALQILTGHLEIIYFESPLLLAYGFLLYQKNRYTNLKIWLKLALALALGIALSAIQLAPAIAFLPYSIRNQGLSQEMIQAWSHHPLLSLLFLLPDYGGQSFQNYSLNMLFGEALYQYDPFFINIYAGVLVWVLLFTGLIIWRSLKHRRLFAFFTLMGLICLFFAFGKYTPLHAYFLKLPGSQFFRYPSKFLIFVSFALTLSVSIVLQECFEKVQLRKWLIALALSSASLALFTYLFINQGADNWQPQFTHYIHELRPTVDLSLIPDWLKRLTECILQQLLIFFCLNLLIAGLLLLLKWRPSSSNLIFSLLFLVLSLDLLSSGINALWMTKADLFEKPAEIAQFLNKIALDKHPQERIFIQSNIPIPPSFAPELMEQQQFRRNWFTRNLLGNYSLKYQFRSVSGAWPARSESSEILAQLYANSVENQQDVYLKSYLSMNSARYLLTSSLDKHIKSYQSNKTGYQLLQSYDATGILLWENKDWLPRARFQDQALLLKDSEAAVSAMIHPQETGFNYQKHVLLLDNEELKQARRQIPTQIAPQKHFTQPVFELERNNELKISFETNTSGYFVLADQNLPGWSATDNGAPSPILTANYNQRAIRVGPGKHLIHFKYDPPGFKAGLVISTFAALIWLGLAIWTLKKQARELDLA